MDGESPQDQLDPNINNNAQEGSPQSDVGELAVGYVAQDESKQHDNDQGRIQDSEKAYDMASAGNEARSNAAGARRFRQLEEDGKEFGVHDLHRQVAERNELLPPIWRPRERYKEAKERQERWATRDAMEHELSNLDSHGVSGREFFEQSQDELAEQLENWAGILYDKPVSEHYAATHEGLTFSPESLATTATSVVKMRREAAWYSAQAKDRTRIQGKSIGSLTGSIDLLLDEASDKLVDEYSDLSSNPDTRIADLQDFYSKLAIKVKVEPLQTQAKILSGVLEDIRSGRASESEKLNA